MPAPMERPPGRFVALVAGDGELLGATRAYCDAHDLVRSGHVVFAGAVTTEAMPGYMAASDVFFLPSRWEGIALSIYEAMAAGLAVLGADVGGQRELVHEGTGVLMPGPDECGSAELEAQGYAYALAGLVINPARRAALGAAARERITRHFELDHMRRRMLEIFDRAAELKERDPRDTLTPGLARELAQQAVEFARMDALNEELWPYKARCDEADRVARDLAAAQSAQAAAARERGLKVLAISDHSGSLGVAGGMSVEKLRERGLELVVQHRVAAVLHDHGLARVLLQPGQCLDQDGRLAHRRLHEEYSAFSLT